MKMCVTDIKLQMALEVVKSSCVTGATGLDLGRKGTLLAKDSLNVLELLI